jgi:Calcineurin-like phosphoesterase
LLRIFSTCACAASVTAALIAVPRPIDQTAAPGVVQFVFTADAHYGITRSSFRGAKDVNARIVNRALVASINALTATPFPADGGLRARGPVGPIDFVVEGGDVSNRADVVDGKAIESAASTWRAFVDDYVNGVSLTDAGGRKAPVLVVPGNHDASNAVGFYKPMMPATDVSTLVGMFNLMRQPSTPLSNDTFAYDRDRVLASRDVGGVHFAFLHVWPDSRGRAWLTEDLSHVAVETPVVLFAHVGPEPDSRHFRNPNGRHDLNETDAFENLLSDEFTERAPAALEQFVAAHPNISAYFHGHSNFNQFYDWTGPHGTVALHTFRVDSPMKGAISKDDETTLSFQIATIDVASRTMTVREVLWNAHPDHPSLTWGGSTTVALSPRLNPDGAALSYFGGDE